MRGIFTRCVCLCLSALLFAFAFACSGDGKKAGLEANLLNYNEVEMVTFTISGNAVCSKCEQDEIPIDMMELQAYQKGNPTDQLALKVYGGLGPFTLQNIRAASGATVEIDGKLYRQGKSGKYITAYYGYGEIAVPDEDDTTVSLTLKFPSSEPDED